MLCKIIRMLDEGALSSIPEMAESLGVSRETLNVMLDDLERMGVLRKLSQGVSCACSCPGCSGSCGNSVRVGMWELTEEYRSKNEVT